MYLGTLEPRKNILSIIRAYAGLSPDLRARHHLILAGKKGWGNEDYEGEATILGVANTCEFLGFVNGEKRLELLKTARALVWPSIYEGFGLPALEAMSVGTPVVTSNVSSIPEITGDAAILCEPYDIDAIRVGIERLLTDNSYWRHLCAAGFERSKAFRWDESASATMDVMESVAG